ncbi:MAG: hypothetical protein ABW163_07470 [Luteimonas sp.]
MSRRLRGIAAAALLWYLAGRLVFGLQVAGTLGYAEAPGLWRQPVGFFDPPLPDGVHVWVLAGPLAGVLGSIALWQGSPRARDAFAMALCATGAQVFGTWDLVTATSADTAALLLRGTIALGLVTVAVVATRRQR